MLGHEEAVRAPARDLFVPPDHSGRFQFAYDISTVVFSSDWITAGGCRPEWFRVWLDMYFDWWDIDDVMRLDVCGECQVIVVFEEFQHLCASLVHL